MRNLDIVGGTVEDQKVSVINKKEDPGAYKKTLEKFLEDFKESVNFLIHHGHVNAWDYYYEDYKLAVKHVRKFCKLEIMGFATAISLVLGGKESLRKFLQEQ